MQNDSKISLDDAYALKTPADNVALYRHWAETYDVEFAQNRGYQYPKKIADIYAHYAKPDDNPILDVGSGTGLVGAALQEHQAINAQLTIDGVDISPEMLAKPNKKSLSTSLRGGLNSINRPTRKSIRGCSERRHFYPRPCWPRSASNTFAPLPRWGTVCNWRQWNGV